MEPSEASMASTSDAHPPLPSAQKVPALEMAAIPVLAVDIEAAVASVEEGELPTETIPSTEESISRSRHRVLLIIFALCITTFVVALDTFIMTTALPVIAVEFGTTDATYAWIGSAYLLSFAVVVPVWAKSSDIFGRKPILIITSVLFFIGTIVGALAKNAAILIAGRAIQGSGGGGLAVLSNICVGDLFSVRERGLYYGIVGFAYTIAAASGPIIAGALTQAATWRWCFWINIPFTAISFVLIVSLLDIHTSKISFFQGIKAIDWLGSLSIVSAALLLLTGLQLGGTKYPWSSNLVICLIVFGVIGFGAFGLVEWKLARQPIMPLRFFARRSRVATLAVNISQSYVTTACTYFLPLYFQIVLDVSPLFSGIYLLPFAMTLSFFYPCVGYLVKLTGEYRTLIQIGFCSLSIGSGNMINFQSYTSWPRIIITQMLLAIGLGLTYQAPLIAFHAQIDQKDVATGTSCFQFLKTLSQTMSVILGQVIFQAQFQKFSDKLVKAGISSGLSKELTTGNAISATTVIRALTGSQQRVVHEALVAALNDMWIFYTVLAFLGLIASLCVAKVKLAT